MITSDSPAHRDIAVMTNDKGEYRFDNLIHGEYTILVNAKGYVMKSLKTRVNTR